MDDLTFAAWVEKLESSRQDCFSISVDKGSKRLLCLLAGPEGTPYEGGLFSLRADHYALVHFYTPILHPNVEANGVMRVRQSSDRMQLSAIVDVLKNPNWDYAVNFEAALLYFTAEELFVQKAREWTLRYAC